MSDVEAIALDRIADLVRSTKTSSCSPEVVLKEIFKLAQEALDTTDQVGGAF